MKLVPRKALDELEPLAHLARAPPLFRAQARLPALRSLRALPERERFIRTGEARPAEAESGFSVTDSSLISPRPLRHGRCRIRFLAMRSNSFCKLLQFLIGEFFQIDQVIARAAERANQFIEFQMNRFGVAVLRVLDQEDHQESDDGGAGIDDELPGIGVMKKCGRSRPRSR